MSAKLATGFLSFDIPHLFREIPEIFLESQILITVRDGDEAGSHRFLFPFDVIGWPNATLIPTSAMTEFLHMDFFDGFDEIYVLPVGILEPMSIPRFFQPDQYDFGKHVPSEFFEVYDALKARAFFSDGCGGNFAVKESILPKLQEKCARL